MICHPLWLFCVPRFNAFRILHRVPLFEEWRDGERGGGEGGVGGGGLGQDR
jgi:hypothetical protein